MSWLEDYDWEQAFEYARSPRNTLPDRCPEKSWERPDDGNIKAPRTKGFTREDVTLVIAQDDGEGDGDQWIMLGELIDGRYFFLYAGCDYTGWDCQAGGGSYVSHSVVDLIRYTMTDEDRKRFGVDG